MTDTVTSIKNEFPVWYSDVSIDADETVRSFRLGGIAKLTGSADRGLVECLIRAVFDVDKQKPSESSLNQVREVFKALDPAFDAVNSVKEMQVLAAATLVNLFNESDTLGDIAALSVTTASLNGSRKLDLPMDLLSLAENALDKLSVEERRRPDLSTFSNAISVELGDGLVTTEEDEAAETIDANDLASFATEIRSSLESLSERQASVASALSQFIKVQDEELQVLWWYIGGRSNALDCNFDQITQPARPLIFGKELADETFILPGLRTVQPLMARAGIKEDSKLSIPDMVTGTKTDWLTTVMNDDVPSPVTQPLHFAISRRLEVDDKSSWVDGWAGITGINANKKISALKLGELFYREQLLRQFS